MERLMPGDLDQILTCEHLDRYRFKDNLIRGCVLDVACGIGIGTEYISSLEGVEMIYGRDISDEAIELAIERQEGDVDYSVGSITNLEFEDNFFDSILTFETLEHLSNPSEAIAELSRVLKPQGIIIGSVPHAHYDEKCEEVYGPNPYHLTRFRHSDLSSLLDEHFYYTNYFMQEVKVASFFTKFNTKSEQEIFSGNYACREAHSDFGSIIFVCANYDFSSQSEEHSDNFVSTIMPMVTCDEARVNPIREAFETAEQRIIALDEALASNEKMIEERDAYIRELEKRVPK